MYFNDGLKIGMCFFQNPVIIFCPLFCIFNSDYFRVQILLKYIESMYLVLEEKHRDIVFGIPWCLVPCAWLGFLVGILFFFFVFFFIFDLEK